MIPLEQVCIEEFAQALVDAKFEGALVNVNFKLKILQMPEESWQEIWEHDGEDTCRKLIRSIYRSVYFPAGATP
jgi:hypothetical protein